ncbi:other/IRE protein kinase [Coprinopsis sp. MPI-PUGE-AT-0042]|nr:other/IRE protein kinase [Coprinopsis sp. MPI-PUGE-AT-0042]
MAFSTYFSLLVLLLSAVCWAEIINVRSNPSQPGALIRRSGQRATYASERLPETTNEQELLDIVLIASVDGKFRALNRTSGMTLWSMPSFQRGAGPAGPSTLAPLVRTEHANYDPDDIEDVFPETYIIEPQSGDIYVVNPTDSSLQRFPFTMPELVDMSPFTAPGDDERRVFIGRKETTLLLLELETGKIKATLNSECPPYEDKSIDLDELEEPDSRGPSTTEVFVGRTDYYISIYSQGSNRHGSRPPVQNLSFSVYGANNKDNILQASYRRTADDSYIQGLPNGEIYAFKRETKDGRTDAQPLWVQDFKVPTVAVFDVLRGRTPLQHHPHAFVLLQPRPRVEDVIPGADLKMLRGGNSAYVGMVGETGSLYVLTPSHYPLVAFGTAETKHGGRLLDDGQKTPQTFHDIIRNQRRLKCEETPMDRECLLGMHTLDSSDGNESRMRRLLEGPQSIKPIPSMRPGQNQWLEQGYSSIPNDLVATPNNSQPATSMPGEQVRKSGWEVIGVTIGLGILSLYFVFKKYGSRWDGSKVKEAIGLAKNEVNRAPTLTEEKPELTAVVVPEVEIPDVPEPSTPLPEPPTPLPVTAEEPIPRTSTPPADEGDDTDREGEHETDAPAVYGKKKRRGKRGKKKKKDASQSEDGSEVNGVDHPVLNGSMDGVDVLTPTAGPGTPSVASMLVSPVPPPAPATTSLVVSETILGFGSHGTVVFEGSLQGRAVAVKRLLKDFVTLASREVSILQESDDHPNVIRYYYQEAHSNFLYIALELCPASLADIVEYPDRDAYRDIAISFDPKKALNQITSGLKHLHALKLVHRDIKPQNILITANKTIGRGRPTYRMLISDFGLCKKLEFDQTSFLPTVNGGLAAGTVGWRAPEILRGEVKLDDLDDHSMSSRGSVSTVNGNGSIPGSATAKPTRLTKSVDIFALGCLYYYTLTNGSHPYGDRFEREVNILKDAKTLDLLERFGEEGTEACDLITHMLDPEASQRPDTSACLLHPFFWNPERRLNFLQDASDRFEIMCRDPKDPDLLELERGAFEVVGADWHSRLDKIFIENLGKFRKYDGKSVQDLLRALRNKKHHYQDLPDNVKRHLGPMPEGYLAYFTKRYPELFLHVHRVISDTGLRTESMFRSYFELPDS